MKQVKIVIQARSLSSRLPNKIFEKIGEIEILQHVIDACRGAEAYVKRHSVKYGYDISTCVACPTDDPLVQKYKRKVQIIEGDEHDVLSRYVAASKGVDWVVRITADCPLIPQFLISKATMHAVKNRYDYLSNVDERCRTAVDGHDVEVISTPLLEWLNEQNLSLEEREHVTLKIRTGHANKSMPDWFLPGCIHGALPLQNIKLSVDTLEDLEKVRRIYDLRKKQEEEARRVFGDRHVHKY